MHTPTPSPIFSPSPTPALIDSDGDGVPDRYDYAPYDPNVQTKSDNENTRCCCVQCVKKNRNEVVQRAHHRGRESYRDKKPERSESKITLGVELTILTLRTTFDWGTARIQQGLIALPEYAREVIPHGVQALNLSRASINEGVSKVVQYGEVSPRD